MFIQQSGLTELQELATIDVRSIQTMSVSQQLQSNKIVTEPTEKKGQQVEMKEREKEKKREREREVF